ncbi:MAG: thioesterase [Ferruginibacter sp.]
MNSTQQFLELVQHPFKYRLFLLKKLPSAFFSGVRVKYADEHKAIVIVPYKWFSTNPFKSTYFACLGMAAEMSTGLLAMAHSYGQQPAISMLIVKSEASFLKKAKGLTRFTCEDGLLIQQVIKEAMATGKSTTVSARSTGLDESGDIVAEFIFTWSFKAKTGQ